MNRRPAETVLTEHEFHFFISHASEDKEKWALPLKSELEELGCKVWIDSEQIDVGDFLAQQIDDGLAKSKYVVAIISEHWLSKKWPGAEGQVGLKATVEGAHGRILPIRHKVSAKRLESHSKMLGSLYSLSTEYSIRRLAAALVRAISRPEDRAKSRTSSELRDLAQKAKEPEGVEALHYLSQIAQAQAPILVPIRTAFTWPGWGLALILFLVIAGLAAGSVAYIRTAKDEPTRLLGEARTQLQEERGKNNKLQTLVAQREKKLNEEAEKNSDLQTRVSQAEAKLKDEQGKNAGLLTQLSQAEAKLKDEQGKSAGLLTQLSQAETKLNDEQRKSAGLLTQLSQAETKLKDEHVKSGGLLTALSQAETKLKEEVAKGAKLQTELDKLTARVAKNKSDYAALEKELETVTKEKDRLDTQLDKSQKDIDARRTDWEKTDKENAELRKSLKESERQRLAAENKLEELEEPSGGTKIVHVYAANAQVDVKNDSEADMDEESIKGPGGFYQVSVPPDSKVLLVLHARCYSFTGNALRQTTLAVPVQLVQATQPQFYFQW